MTKPTQITETGPLLGLLPPPPDVRTRLLLVEKLGGHTTAPGWLPPGLSPEVDQLRDEMLRLRRQLVAILEERAALLAKHAVEDKAHAELLKQAAREGTRTSEDRRTPPERRDQDLGAVDAKVWAGISVMGELADQVIEHLRRNEDTYLADQRMQLEPLRAEREEAARLLAEVESEAWRCHQLGRWVQTTTDDGGFGRQPAPALVTPPAQQPAPA